MKHYSKYKAGIGKDIVHFIYEFKIIFWVGFGSRFKIEEGYRLWIDETLHSNSYMYFNDDSYSSGWLCEPTSNDSSDGK
jgi:hypothetical protein